MCSLTVLEVRNQISFTGLKSGCWQGGFLLEPLGENRLPYLSWLLEAAHILWLVTPSSKPLTFISHLLLPTVGFLASSYSPVITSG